MPVSTFLTKTTETTIIQVIMYETLATRNQYFTLLGQGYYSKDCVCTFLTCLKYYNSSINAKNLKNRENPPKFQISKPTFPTKKYLRNGT